MFTLYMALVLESTVFVLPTTMAQKVTLYTEWINANFSGTLNSLNYAATLASSTDNDIYTFKQMLHQPDAK